MTRHRGSEPPENQGVPPDLTAGTGELGRAVAALDWSTSLIGASAQWSVALRSVVSILLTSRFSMWMGWGPDLTAPRSGTTSGRASSRCSTPARRPARAPAADPRRAGRHLRGHLTRRRAGVRRRARGAGALPPRHPVRLGVPARRGPRPAGGLLRHRLRRRPGPDRPALRVGGVERARHRGRAGGGRPRGGGGGGGRRAVRSRGAPTAARPGPAHRGGPATGRHRRWRPGGRAGRR